MIDRQGYRSNVGIILYNTSGRVFWARRSGESSWQFPQGGINANEAPEEALYRELEEETGLLAKHVELIGRTSDWLRYEIPKKFLRGHPSRPRCIGQKQIWFLLKFIGKDDDIALDSTDHAEFDSWCWTDYQETSDKVISFKSTVYQQALSELMPLVENDAAV